MRDFSRPEGLRPRIVTRRRALAALAALATGLGWAAWAWWTMVRMPGVPHEGPLPPLTDAQRRLARELEADIRALTRLGERSVVHPHALADGAALLVAALEAAGHRVERQSYELDGVLCENLVVRYPGRDSSKVVVVGAHYDSASGTPGANDDGSGVAALLALARRIPPGFAGERTLELVALTNEEMPHFRDGTMGSQLHARQHAQRGDEVVAMLSLETMGYFDDAPGSQAYPFPLSAAYPDRGDFIAFVGDRRSAPLVREAVRSFRAHARFPSEGAALPSDLPGVGWSDHRSYWEHGWPALMVTDTAPFRYPHYHLPTDTPERVDYERLARVVDGLAAVVKDLVR